MITDDAFKGSVYKAPPENLEAARERVQLFWDVEEDREICREAVSLPPDDAEAALARVHAAGIHPSNLIEMVWKSVDQFTSVLQDIGWQTEVYCHDKTMSSGRYKVLFCVAKADRNNKIFFWLWEKPHMLVVLAAKTASASEASKKVVKEVAEVMDRHSTDFTF